MKINFWILLCGLLYFYFWFISFIYLSRLGLLGVLFHSLVMVSFSFFKIIFPLHPLILLYPFADTFLPNTKNTFFNLFVLFFLSGVLFCQSALRLRILFFIITLFFLSTNTQTRVTEKKNLKIAIVQVGLYFDKGGTTKNFFNELIDFLSRHPEVNAVAFSENNFFSYKTDYNKEMSNKLLIDIRKENLHQKLHLFLAFNAYKNFNNVVTLYKHKELTYLNQKKTLIPFIEKPSFFNENSALESQFFYIDEKHQNKVFEIMNNTVSTHICYDALFPEKEYAISDIVIIQSNYKLLDKGDGFKRLKLIATYLAKFVNGIHSQVVINIQNTGGTVVLFDGWRFDNEIYEISKKEAFFIIDTSKL
ncbi:hypothetical protein E1394_23505 [Salmonella enterica subsp. enterica serovar Gaminara]|nr:hypothetical protein [Salmonella enterica subsp. enterica serovar Gaminara]